MKYKLHLKQGLPFASCPAIVELEGCDILCNDVMLPPEIDAASKFNPRNIRLFVIGHEFGAKFAVFAACEQDALDEGVDHDRMDWALAADQTHDDDENRGLAVLGNAGELFDLSYAWTGEVELEAARDILLITALARAAGTGEATLP